MFSRIQRTGKPGLIYGPGSPGGFRQEKPNLSYMGHQVISSFFKKKIAERLPAHPGEQRPEEEQEAEPTAATTTGSTTRELPN